MKESQREIQAIQAKLQNIGRRSLRHPAPHPAHPPAVPPAVSQSEATLPRPGVTALVERQFLAPPATDRPATERPAATQDLISTATSLQQRASIYGHLTSAGMAGSAAAPAVSDDRAEQQMAEDMKRLELQVQRINQLSSAQEAAILELRAIAEQVEQDWKAIDLEGLDDQDVDYDVPPVCEYLAAEVPHIEQDPSGIFILTSRTIDLFQAERDADWTAELLRQHSGYRDGRSKSRSRSGRARQQAEGPNMALLWGQRLWTQMLGLVQAIGPQIGSRQPERLMRSQRTQPAQLPPITLLDIVIWVAGAAIARIGINLLLGTFPGLWPAVVALIVTPAAIAVYRTTVAPHTGFVLGYRLMLIMVGLLLGGRL